MLWGQSERELTINHAFIEQQLPITNVYPAAKLAADLTKVGDLFKAELLMKPDACFIGL